MVRLCLSPCTHTLSCVVCRCAVVLPMQKETCLGGSPLSSSSPCSLVGPTPSLVPVGGAGRALVAPLVCAAWHNMVTYLRGSLLSLLIFMCDASLRAHLDQVPLNYPSETVVQPSSTAHFHYGFPTVEPLSCEAGSDPRGHLGVTWGVYLCAGRPPLADIILSHPPDLTRCDSVIGLAIPAMSGHIQYRGTASGDLYIGISGINRVLLS